MQILLHPPQSEKEQKELASRTALLHVELILSYLEQQSFSPQQKDQILKELLKRLS